MSDPARPTAWWCAGAPATEAGFDEAASGFLGCGFEVVVADDAGALAHAHGGAARVAALLGTVLDEAPWQRARSEGGPLRLSGGWPYGLDRSLGPCWTRLTPLVPVTSTPAEAGAEAVDLPWPHDPRGPLAGLPVLDGLPGRRAAAYLAERAPDGLGLWWDVGDRLVSTTRGAPLVRADGRWHAPATTWRGWPAEQLAAHLGADPEPVAREVVDRADLAVAVDALGRRTRWRG